VHLECPATQQERNWNHRFLHFHCPFHFHRFLPLELTLITPLVVPLAVLVVVALALGLF
jgi:hypothetical protein